MTLLRGALIEYGSDFLGPLPNVVVFQFNPETMSRAIQIPPRPTGGAARETTQAGEPPIERITIKAEFSAMEGQGGAALLFGVGPQLAALEQMVRPTNTLGGLLGQAIDAIGTAISPPGKAPEQAIPRERYPRILFIWGLTRALPVVIDSMTITEQLYDTLLNPVQADVAIGMSVVPIAACADDAVGRGALAYSTAAKEAQAAINLATTAGQALELVPF